MCVITIEAISVWCVVKWSKIVKEWLLTWNTKTPCWHKLWTNMPNWQMLNIIPGVFQECAQIAWLLPEVISKRISQQHWIVGPLVGLTSKELGQCMVVGQRGNMVIYPFSTAYILAATRQNQGYVKATSFCQGYCRMNQWLEREPFSSTPYTGPSFVYTPMTCIVDQQLWVVLQFSNCFLNHLLNLFSTWSIVSLRISVDQFQHLCKELALSSSACNLLRLDHWVIKLLSTLVSKANHNQ